MFKEADHGLTEEGKNQAEELRVRLQKDNQRLKDKVVPIWEVEFLERLLHPAVIFASPFTRAIETAVIALYDVVRQSTGEIVVLREAREQRNCCMSVDSSGVAVGDGIRSRVDSELRELYDSAAENERDETNVQTDPNGGGRSGGDGGGSGVKERAPTMPDMDAIRLDVSGVQDEWWSASADTEEDIAARQRDFLKRIREAGEGTSVIVVGHSHFFRRFFRDQLTREAWNLNTDIAASLEQKVIHPACVIGLRMDWTAFDRGAGCIGQAVHLVGSKLEPADRFFNADRSSYCSRAMCCGLNSAQAAHRPFVGPPRDNNGEAAAENEVRTPESQCAIS